MSYVRLLCAVAAASAAFGQAPPNDACAAATVLTDGVVVDDGTLAGSTATFPEPPGCAAIAGDLDRWYVWTAPSNGVARVTRGGYAATSVAVYTGACGALSLVPMTCGTSFQLMFAAAAGADYYVRVGRSATEIPPNESFTLRLDFGPTVASSDSCAGAAPLADGFNGVSATTATASPAGTAPACSWFAASTADLWFTYVASATGEAALLRTPGPSSGEVWALAVYTGTCGSLVSAGPDSCSSAAQVVFPAIAGQTYVVRVGATAGSAAFLPFLLRIDCVPPPPNDQIDGALPLSVGLNPVPGAGPGGATFSNLGAPLALDSASGAIPGLCAPASRDVYFYWTAPCDGPVEIETCNPPGASPASIRDSVLQVLDPSGTTALGCNDDACFNPVTIVLNTLSRVAFTAAGGATYFVRVSSYGANGLSGGFYVSVRPQATAVAFGAGCGSPALALTGTAPELGASATLVVAGEASAFGLIAFSAPMSAPTPVGPCTAYVDLNAFGVLLTFATDGAGGFSVATPLPADPTLACLRLDLQAALLGTAGLALSNGLRATLGY
jgi:hypothetical protein